MSIRPALTLLLATATLSVPLAYAGYEDHPRFAEFAQELKAEYKVPESEARRWLSEAKRQDSVLAAIQKPAEGTMEWDRYQDIFLTKSRIDAGKKFLKDHADLLLGAEQKYGVPKEIITAILGVETFYGTRQGNYRVLDSLATLAFDYPQRPIFWRELKALFGLAEVEGVDPGTIKGSYAGAMGYGQFIPSSYLAYAVDGDGDGKRDLWNNPADAIYSVAAYFHDHGWTMGEPVIERARVTGSAYEKVINDNLKPNWTVTSLATLGATSTVPLAGDRKANLVRLMGKQGAEFWIGLNNYYVITRYNHSRLYAMAVHQLSEAFR